MNVTIETLNRLGAQFLDFAWPMLWQSSLLIALVYALDALLARKIRAAVRHALWLVVLAKLLLPPTLALPTGAAWWLCPRQPINTFIPQHFVVRYPEPMPVSDDLPASVPTVPPTARLDRAGGLLLAVGGVGAGLLLWLLLRWRLVIRLTRQAKTAQGWDGLIDEVRQSAGLRGPLRLRIVDQAMSPAVCGLFRPVILLPRMLAEKLTASQLRAVLLHEACHLRRWDIWVNCAQAVLQVLYWWHPLVWLANARMRRVCEDAVDDAVMLALAAEAEVYAPTLLEVARLAFRRPMLSLGLVGTLESRSALRQRIERLMDFRAPHRAGLTLASLCGICAFSAVALPMGKAPAPTETEFAPASVTATAPATTPLPVTEPAATPEHPPSTTPPPSVLVQARIYQLPTQYWTRLVSGLPRNPEQRSHDSWHSIPPGEFSGFLDRLKQSGAHPLTMARVLTTSGKEADFYTGDGTNDTEFNCTPTVDGERLNLVVQGWTVVADHRGLTTNKFGTHAILPDHGGMVLRSQNADAINASNASNVVVVLNVEIVTNQARFQPRLVPLARPSTNEVTPPASQLHSLGGPASFDDSVSGAQPISYQWPRNGANLADGGNGSGPTNAPQTEHPAALDRIRLSVQFTDLDQRLSRIVRQLNALAKENDPDHVGIEISLATNACLPRWEDINSVVIDNLSLVDVRLGDVLEGLAMVAKTPITYSFKDGAVIFTASGGPKLFQRTFRVDEQAFAASVHGTSQNAAAMDSHTSAAAEFSRGELAAFFGKAGIDWQSPSGKAFFNNEKLGLLFVKATLPDLDKIESMLQRLSPPSSPEIHLQARFIQIPVKDKETLGRLGRFLTLTNPADERAMGVLSSRELQETSTQLRSARGVVIEGLPELTVFSRRPVQFRNTQVQTLLTNMMFQDNYTNTSSISPQTCALETGPVLDAVMNVLSDGHTVHLKTSAQDTEFYGYAPVPSREHGHIVTNSTGDQIKLALIWPAVLTRIRSAAVDLRDGQTLLLPLDQSRQVYYEEPSATKVATIAKHISSARKKLGEKATFVFITPTLVDPTGNRIYPDIYPDPILPARNYLPVP